MKQQPTIGRVIYDGCFCIESNYPTQDLRGKIGGRPRGDGKGWIIRGTTRVSIYKYEEEKMLSVDALRATRLSPTYPHQTRLLEA